MNNTELVIYRFYTKNAAKNLALEEYFLNRSEKNIDNVYLFLYENSNSIILGKSLVLDHEVFLHKKLPPVYRRSSGGGSVVHFDGNINYGLLFSTQKFTQYLDIKKSYSDIMGSLANGFKNWLELSMQGQSDLSTKIRNQFRKISGNAQVRRRNWVLHHGTILYSRKQFSKISFWLRPPPKQPEYRKNRTHKDFLVPALPSINRPEIEHQIIQSFKDLFNAQEIRRKQLNESQVRVLNRIKPVQK